MNGKLALAAVACVALAGCAQLDAVKPGTALTVVEQQFGRPTTTCPLPAGQTRVVWSQQPFGHYAWATVVNPQGQVGEIEQVLTDKSFERLSEGEWTPQEVVCAFGPPMNIDQVGLPSNLKTVWSYRYRQYGVWYSLMYVFFGTDGKQVTQHYAGPDPMFFDDRSLFGL